MSLQKLFKQENGQQNNKIWHKKNNSFSLPLSFFSPLHIPFLVSKLLYNTKCISIWLSVCLKHYWESVIFSAPFWYRHLKFLVKVPTIQMAVQFIIFFVRRQWISIYHLFLYLPPFLWLLNICSNSLCPFVHPLFCFSFATYGCCHPCRPSLSPSKSFILFLSEFSVDSLK